jgi:hypothetical protein
VEPSSFDDRRKKLFGREWSFAFGEEEQNKAS